MRRVVMLIACAGPLAACSPNVDCTLTMDTYYNKGCQVSPDSAPLTKSQAVSWCETMKPKAETCQCTERSDSYLGCLGDAAQTLCGACVQAGSELSVCLTLCNCTSLIDHFYRRINCSLTSGGEPIDAAAATQWCENARPRAQTCGCTTQLDSLLECLARSGYQQCDNCDAQFEAHNTCFNACGG
jgi:hypothetical protein